MFIKYFNLFRKSDSLGFVLPWPEGHEARLAGRLACAAQGPHGSPGCRGQPGADAKLSLFNTTRAFLL